MANVLPLQLEEYGTEHYWFQQDEATTYSTSRSRAIFRMSDQKPWNSRFAPPTLAPVAFWEVYNHRTQTLQEKKEAIAEEIDRIHLDLWGFKIVSRNDNFAFLSRPRLERYNELKSNQKICLICTSNDFFSMTYTLPSSLSSKMWYPIMANSVLGAGLAERIDQGKSWSVENPF